MRQKLYSIFVASISGIFCMALALVNKPSQTSAKVESIEFDDIEEVGNCIRDCWNAPSK